MVTAEYGYRPISDILPDIVGRLPVQVLVLSGEEGVSCEIGSARPNGLNPWSNTLVSNH